MQADLCSHFNEGEHIDKKQYIKHTFEMVKLFLEKSSQTSVQRR